MALVVALANKFALMAEGPGGSASVYIVRNGRRLQQRGEEQLQNEVQAEGLFKGNPNGKRSG